MIDSLDKQNIHLSGFISLCKTEDAASHDATYQYRIRVTNNEGKCEQLLCRGAFLSINQTDILQTSLKEKGEAPVMGEANILTAFLRIQNIILNMRKTHYSL